jgi:hypothetical protein
MKLYIGYYYCTESNWDDKLFDTSYLVSIEQYDKKDLINNKIDFLNPKAFSDDFKNVIDVKFLYPDDKIYSWKTFFQLKPEVFSWLEQNVTNKKHNKKAWCCGNKEYNSDNPVSQDFDLFFYRKKDALNFIKTWSILKKPTLVYNQFTYVKKVLNTKTNKYSIIK